MMRNTTTIVMGILFVLCFAQSGWAAPIELGDRILIDCGTANDAPNPDGLGRRWNVISAAVVGTTSNLKNTAGVTTDVDISWTVSLIDQNIAGTTASVITDYPSFATRDSYWNTTSTPAQCVVRDLNTALTYNLTIYGSRGVTTDRIMQATIGGVSKSYNAGGTAGEGLVTFTGLSPNSSGEITIDFAATTNNGYVGVIDLTAAASVPEPMTMTLLGSGLALSVLKRRNR